MNVGTKYIPQKVLQECSSSNLFDTNGIALDILNHSISNYQNEALGKTSTSANSKDSCSSGSWRVISPPAFLLLPLPLALRNTLTEYAKLLPFPGILLNFGASHPDLWHNWWRTALGIFFGSPCHYLDHIKKEVRTKPKIKYLNFGSGLIWHYNEIENWKLKIRNHTEKRSKFIKSQVCCTIYKVKEIHAKYQKCLIINHQ